MQLAEDIRNRLPETVRNVALPALVGGAGTGALSAYMSAKARPEGESPRQRRHRILRNALVGTLLGGTAGAALPTGLNLLTEPFFGGPRGVAPIQRATNFGLRNAVPGAALGGGAWWMHRAGQANRNDALKSILGRLPAGMTTPAGGSLSNIDQLKELLERGPNDRSWLVKTLAGAENGITNPKQQLSHMFRHNELLGEAGYRGMSLKDIAGHLSSGVAGESSPDSMRMVQEALRSHLAEHSGPIASRLSPGMMENYSNIFRPSAARTIGRWSTVPKLGLLAGGVLAAKKVQDSLSQ